MSNLPDIPRNNEFTVSILKGTSPVVMREVVRRSMSAPGNHGLMSDAIQRAAKPSTETLIASAYLWKEAHDTDPNPSLGDRINWYRGKKLYRYWETGDLIDPEDPTLTQDFKFRDYKKDLLEMTEYMAQFSPQPGFPYSNRLDLHFGPQNLLRTLRFSGIEQTREQMLDFATSHGGASFRDYLQTNFIPANEQSESQKQEPVFTYSSFWDLDKKDVTTSVRITERYVQRYSSNTVTFDAGRGVLLRSWPGYDGREHTENATKWGLPTNFVVEPITYINDLQAVLSIIPSELHGED